MLRAKLDTMSKTKKAAVPHAPDGIWAGPESTCPGSFGHWSFPTPRNFG